MKPPHMSGLEFIQAIIDGKIPHPSMAETIPMKMVKAIQGEVTFEVKADDRHTNPMGGVHGGFAATVLDSITGCAIHTELEPGIGYGTIDLNVKVVKPIPKDETLIATGRVINISKRLGVSEGRIMDQNGKLIAYGTSSCMIIGR
ncbi:MAG: PaaI family thioesterase [Gammaproteobacteria bacterium]|nr:PaaI family thioesterase [Gammaproteobacteria bacterium]